MLLRSGANIGTTVTALLAAVSSIASSLLSLSGKPPEIPPVVPWRSFPCLLCRRSSPSAVRPAKRCRLPSCTSFSTSPASCSGVSLSLSLLRTYYVPTLSFLPCRLLRALCFSTRRCRSGSFRPTDTAHVLATDRRKFTKLHGRWTLSPLDASFRLPCGLGRGVAAPMVFGGARRRRFRKFLVCLLQLLPCGLLIRASTRFVIGGRVRSFLSPSFSSRCRRPATRCSSRQELSSF